MSAKQYFFRFRIAERIEHLVLVLSFTTLAVTGLIQKYSQAVISDGLIRLFGGIELTRVIHRSAAILITLEVIYHLVILGYKLFVRSVRPTMLPGIKDGADALRAFGYNLGLTKTRPLLGRFNFVEKAEYWAMIWGTLIMGITGYMMWNPAAISRILPGVVIPAAKAAHGGEAVLAVLAILVWHFYNVHLKKLNLSMINGKLSRAEMEEEHALELQELESQAAVPETPLKVLRKRQKIFFPVASVVSVVLVFLVFKLVTAEKAPLAVVPPAESAPVFLPQTPIPVPTAQPLAGVSMDPAVVKLWTASAHAQAGAQAFINWNSDVPAEVPAACAKCHSTPGFNDYIGADGSTPFQVDKAAPVGTVINCTACHNETANALSTVKFPSGVEIKGLGREALCMTCHQGTASTVQVDEILAKADLTDEDAVAAPGLDMGFINIHYFAAAVSRYGTQVKGGYEYPGQIYDGLFEHASGAQTCIECHDQHSLQVKVDKCQGCHPGVTKVEDLSNIRMAGSNVDYNGNGNVTEGLYYEIDGLRTMLYKAIQAYASEVARSPIVYDAATYPYFFNDKNGNSAVDKDELVFANRYTAWTARLEKAAFNLQTAVKDPGGYAHGGKYIIELVYDSIASLNEKISAKVDLSKANRNSSGHFDSAAEAFRYWDQASPVPSICARCHSGAGLPQLINEGASKDQAPTNSLQCITCHDDLTKFTRFTTQAVEFPSGAKLGFAQKPDSNLCIECHQGLESSISVENALAGLEPDTVDSQLGFKNVHYFAAGATLFGTEAKGMYEYPGKTYLGRFTHTEEKSACTDCHDSHTLQARVDQCKACHQETDPTKIRWFTDKSDFNGNGDIQEGLYNEVAGMNAALYTAIQAYARDVAKAPLVYSPAANPYFFIDTNNNGKADADETVAANKYAAWTPRLLKAAYNYQFVVKDPGAYVHNGKYVLQVLYDTLADLTSKAPSVDMNAMLRP